MQLAGGGLGALTGIFACRSLWQAFAAAFGAFGLGVIGGILGGCIAIAAGAFFPPLAGTAVFLAILAGGALIGGALGITKGLVINQCINTAYSKVDDALSRQKQIDGRGQRDIHAGLGTQPDAARRAIAAAPASARNAGQGSEQAALLQHAVPPGGTTRLGRRQSS